MRRPETAAAAGIAPVSERLPSMLGIGAWNRSLESELGIGSDQPHQQTDQRKSADQHRPVSHVELKKPAIGRYVHMREHVLL